MDHLKVIKKTAQLHFRLGSNKNWCSHEGGTKLMKCRNQRQHRNICVKKIFYLRAHIDWPLLQYIRKVNYLIQKLKRRSDFFSISCVVGCAHNTTDNSLQVIDIRQNKLETLILKHASLTWFVFRVLLEILCMCYPPTLTAMPGLVWRQFNPCGSQFRRLCHNRGQ